MSASGHLKLRCYVVIELGGVLQTQKANRSQAGGMSMFAAGRC